MFSSSNAPLGDNAYPASEDKPMAPLSPYGAGKATGEAYCSAFYGAYGFDAVAVRFSNAYGPRSARKSNVIPLFIRKIMAGEPLTIYGDGTPDPRLRVRHRPGQRADPRGRRRPAPAARCSSWRAASRPA